MFKPLIFLLMFVCCNLMIPENALSQMSPEGIKAMREGMMRAQKKAADKEAKKKMNSKGSTPAAQARRDEPADSMAKPEGGKEMKESGAMAPSFKLFDVKPKSLMAVLDSNGDGKLSGKEIDFATDQLLRLDANDNGEIDVDELPGAMAEMASGFDPAYKGPGEQIYKTISGFDADANGVLTRSEMRAEYRGAFRAIDSDGNREINPKELLQFSQSQ